LKNREYLLQGNYYSFNFSYLELKYYKCQNTTNNTNCKSQDIIDSYIDGLTLNWAFVNTYFDFNDYKQQIKYFIDDSLFWELESTKIKKCNFYVQKSEADL
jgi:hypothetical protein